MTVNTKLVVAILCCAMAVQVGSARADDTASAKQQFDEGRKLYNVGDYADALQRFKRAYLIREDPVFIYNIAQCHRQLGQTKEALIFYRRYLSASPKAANRDQVERTISELEHASPVPAAAAPKEPPPAQMTTPPTPPAPAPSPTPAPAPVNLDVAPSSSQTPLVVTATEPTAPPDQPTAPAKPVYARAWFWGLVGGALVIAVVGAAAAGAFTSYEDAPCPQGKVCPK